MNDLAALQRERERERERVTVRSAVQLPLGAKSQKELVAGESGLTLDLASSTTSFVFANMFVSSMTVLTPSWSLPPSDTKSF